MTAKRSFGTIVVEGLMEHEILRPGQDRATGQKIHVWAELDGQPEEGHEDTQAAKAWLGEFVQKNSDRPSKFRIIRKVETVVAEIQTKTVFKEAT